MNLVLGNIDYEMHMTDEGAQLQDGLVLAGWDIAGYGYGPSETDIPTILQHRPETRRVFVQDRRDWDALASTGCFNPKVHFTGLEVLGTRPDLTVFTVVKDAGTVVEFQRQTCELICPAAVVVYYHPDSVYRVSPWLRTYRLVRTYHSVDRAACPPLDAHGMFRRRGVVSGAISSVYPVRTRAAENARRLRIDYAPHPGYGNSGCATPAYLSLLANYRVSVATASAYGFALRKIIESVAVGCTPVTNLPEYDVLPYIDGALVRISANAPLAELADAIHRADVGWDLARVNHYAALARTHYDWMVVGQRLSTALQEI